MTRPEVAARLPYPGPPWRIKGPAAVALGLVDVGIARAHVPADLAIVAVAPGKTLCALMVADYRSDSTLQYSELSVMPALVRCRRHIGGWISSIWVDDVTSLRGGREMWGVPKELADFAWTTGETTRVAVGAGAIATLSWRRPSLLLPAPGVVAAIGSVGGDRRAFSGGGISRLNRTEVRIAVAPDAPFAQLWAQVRPLTSFAGNISLRFGRLRLLAPARQQHIAH